MSAEFLEEFLEELCLFMAAVFERVLLSAGSWDANESQVGGSACAIYDHHCHFSSLVMTGKLVKVYRL